MAQIIRKLINEFKNQKIEYSGISQSLLKTQKFVLLKGVNELGYLEPSEYPKNAIKKIKLKVGKNSLLKVRKILRNFGFKFYSFSESLIFFYFNMEVGLIRLELIFQEDNKNKMFNPPGKFACFVAPEGGGKTTTLSSIYTIFENFPVKRKLLNFSSFKESKIWRIYDLTKKILLVKLNRNWLILSDRYIYMTFRESPLIKKIFRIFAPEPDLVFILKADYQILKKRRGALCQSEEKVRQTYDLFDKAKNKIFIDTSKPIDTNRKIIVDKILDLYDKKNDEKLIRKIISRT